MSQILRIEDIEEFEQSGRVPRAAITDTILDGIRRLNERIELEPALRRILTDQNETPHTSTEQADILTAHVTWRREPRFTAFVNKGKATQRVNAEAVAHQLLRVASVPGVQLLVFLAVGHIQDDIWNAVATTAKGMDADYLVVDAVDVARLLVAYQQVCPRDGSPYREGKCGRCGTAASDPIEVVLRVYERLHYEVHLSDTSTGQAKRYRADVVTAHHYTKAALREVVKIATWEIRQSDYHRSPQVEEAFGDRQADCVALFVYPTERDRQQANWRCRTLWMRPGLPQTARPLPLRGGEWLGEIEIDWNDSYLSRREFHAGMLDGKGEWVRKVEALLPEVERLEREAERLTTAYSVSPQNRDEVEPALEQREAEAMRLTQRLGEGGWPPLDCEECDATFRVAVASLHNVYVPFATWGQAGWDWEHKLRLMESARQQYAEDIERFRYEWRKLRR